MDIKVNFVVGANGITSPSFPDGTVISNGEIDVYGDLNVVGISTLATILIGNGGISTTVYSSSYIGDGSGLAGIKTSSPSRVVGLKYIFSDPPLRS